MFVIFFFFFLSLALGSVRAQDDVGYVDTCPEKFGFYADAVQCDRYYECKDGEIIDHYCPDGLVFDETSTQFAKCSFPFSVDCSDRPELQKAKPTKLCPRQNGYFEHIDPNVCDKFYFCVDGVANEITCPNTLIFDPSKGQCAFSDQVTRKGCTSEEFFKFTCPSSPSASPHEHPRYPDPQDCQFFYICIGGTTARRNGCTVGLVFNPDTLSCDRPENVEGPCRNWYNETFLESLGNPGRGPELPSGVRLDEKPGRRVAVRRRRPTESGNTKPQRAQQSSGVNIAGSPFLDSGRVRTESNVPLSAVEQGSSSFAATRNRNRNRVRTRVRPQPAPEPEQTSNQRRPSGPPSFSLSSDEDIQRFRQQNRFVPESQGGSRLTVLSTGSSGSQRRPRPSLTFEDEDEGDQFSAFPAVPNSRVPPSFESSRRPPSRPSRPKNEQTFEAVPAVPESSPPPRTRSEIIQQRRQQSSSFHSDRFQTDFGRESSDPDESPGGFSSFPARDDPEEQRQDFRSSPGRGGTPPRSRNRLQVTPIKVKPNRDLVTDEDPRDFEAAKTQNARQRFRTRSRARQQN